MASTDEVAPVVEDAKKENGDAASFDGVVKGKYSWTGDVQNKSAELDGGVDITKYSWSDGKKTVSVYVELDGLDDVPEDHITAVSGEKDATLTIAAVGLPPKKRVLKLNGLNAEITVATATKKKGKNMVSLKLTKKEAEAWPKLIATSGGSGGDGGEDEEGPGGGMGGMMGGMGGMGGMMGGMGGMMGGMGDMGGDMGGDMSGDMGGDMGGGIGDMPDSAKEAELSTPLVTNTRDEHDKESAGNAASVPQGHAGNGTVRVLVRSVAGNVMLDEFLPETKSPGDIEETLLGDRKHLGIMPKTKQSDVTSGRFQKGYLPIVELLQDGVKVDNFVTFAYLKGRSNPIELTCVFKGTVMFENNEDYYTMEIVPGTEGDLHTKLSQINHKWGQLITASYPEFILALRRTSGSDHKIAHESKMFEKFEEIAGDCEGMYVQGMCYFEGRIGGHIVSMGIDT